MRRNTVEKLLLYLPIQIRFSIGGKRVTCRGSKLTNSLGKQQHELWTRNVAKQRAVHVRNNYWYISLSCSEKQQREMTNSTLCGELEPQRIICKMYVSNFKLCSITRERERNKVRVRFFNKIPDQILHAKKIQKWILRFFIKQINPRSFGSWHVNG